MKKFFSDFLFGFFSCFDLENIDSKMNEQKNAKTIFGYWSSIIKYFNSSFKYIRNNDQGN
jgi:hypothetical protein